MSSILGEWREVESSPFTGKCSARPAGRPGDLLALERLRRSLPRHSIPAAVDTEAPQYAFFRHGGIYRSDVVKTKPRGGNRLPPVGRPRAPGTRTCREDHALLIVRDEFRPAIP